MLADRFTEQSKEAPSDATYTQRFPLQARSKNNGPILLSLHPTGALRASNWKGRLMIVTERINSRLFRAVTVVILSMELCSLQAQTAGSFVGPRAEAGVF